MSDLNQWIAKAERMEAALRLILPMAKGYAMENDVGSNRRYIQISEDLLKEYEQEAP